MGRAWLVSGGAYITGITEACRPGSSHGNQIARTPAATKTSPTAWPNGLPARRADAAGGAAPAGRPVHNHPTPNPHQPSCQTTQPRAARTREPAAKLLIPEESTLWRHASPRPSTGPAEPGDHAERRVRDHRRITEQDHRGGAAAPPGTRAQCRPTCTCPACPLAVTNCAGSAFGVSFRLPTRTNQQGYVVSRGTGGYLPPRRGGCGYPVQPEMVGSQLSSALRFTVAARSTTVPPSLAMPPAAEAVLPVAMLPRQRSVCCPGR